MNETAAAALVIMSVMALLSVTIAVMGPSQQQATNHANAQNHLPDVEVPSWVSDNFRSESDALVFVGLRNGLIPVDETTWLAQNGFKYCDSVHNYYIVMAKPGHWDIC